MSLLKTVLQYYLDDREELKKLCGNIEHIKKECVGSISTHYEKRLEIANNQILNLKRQFENCERISVDRGLSMVKLQSLLPKNKFQIGDSVWIQLDSGNYRRLKIKWIIVHYFKSSQSIRYGVLNHKYVDENKVFKEKPK